ncbi:EAL domain-containing protein [Leptospira sp. GIMC2001]|uniref:EAL domain-containing protein n=1 Tax=Leptospira sp. GIMC2001 TaxID=1513297 RepID=UPI00234A2CD1|nr:EAL domain-containing protein [Leptospira sp. GIMC2001]WCL51129.1 EAL domain-containing protein [Leptospira sp. GIMC2001]
MSTGIPNGIDPVFLNESFFVPHFQPILNVTTRNVSGYEVLGRLFSPTENQFHSLGSYFHGGGGDDILNVYNVDRIIREKAIRYLKDSHSKTKLFFNIMPNFLSRVHKSDLRADRFHIIQLIEKYEINKADIVLEITEDEFEGSIENLIQMVSVFREYGLTIAIDDLGVGFSNLERIGYLHPDIIKVDIKIMRESLSMNSFKQVLTAVSEMSQKLGSHLLFEGIENEEELNLALSMGANLLQGYYFAKPASNFLNKNYFAKSLKATLEKFAGLRFIDLVDELNKESDLVHSLEGVFQVIQATDEVGLLESFQSILELLPKNITKIFLCDIHGYQTTPTYLRNENGQFMERLSGLGNNYAWKPYFIKHKAFSLKENKKWSITTPLYDIKKQSEYVVFTYSISEELVLVAQVDWKS